jgi:hypothetical protein
LKKKKKKKEISTGHLSAQAAHQLSPRRPTLPLPLFFFPVALTAGARLSASPLPLPFFFTSLPSPSPRRRAIPAAPRRFPSFPPYQVGQLRQLTSPAINWNRYLSISSEP